MAFTAEWGNTIYNFSIKTGNKATSLMQVFKPAYAHKIGKHFHMEYSLGVGYLQRDTKEYDKVNDTMYGDIKSFQVPVESREETMVWSNVRKVSLVWLLNKKTVKKKEV